MRRAEATPGRRRIAPGPIVLLLALGLSGQAQGHGVRLPFAQWGGFSPGAVKCQRIITRSVARCAADAWAAQRICERAKLVGQPCDQTALNAMFGAIKVQALNTVDENCSTERQILELQYLSTIDVDTDISTFCMAWPIAAVSAVYGPLDALGTRTAAQLACSDAAADAAEGAMQFAFRTRRQCMDRIAAESLNTPNRSALLDDAAQRIGKAYDVLAARLATRCGATPFMALYGRTPDAFVAGLGARADCIGGQFYIQDAVLCPNAVCGNGIIEPGEDCDDGNTNDGDACPSTCTFS
jgi:cysteine-rich repeat protein